MEQHTRPLSFARVLFVVSLAAFSLVIQLPDLVLPWHPTGQPGFVMDSRGNVVGVEGKSSADRAGIRVGDSIDFSETPFSSRPQLQPGSPNTLRVGQRLPIAIRHDGELRHVTLVGEAVPRSFADNASDLLLMFSEAALTLIGALLVIKRPSRMTWAFYLYSLSEYSLSVTFVANAPPAVATLGDLAPALLGPSWFWLVIFALRFPNDRVARSMQLAERLLLASLVVIVPLNVWGPATFIFGRLPPPALIDAADLLLIAGLLAAAAIFAVTYIHAVPKDRARIRWVIVGIVAGYSGQAVDQIGATLPGVAVAWPIWVINVSQASQVLMSLSVAYAVIRHRVFDVRFFIGRAVVYGALTSAVVATLALVDYMAGKLLAGTGLAALGEATLAVIVGISLSGVHKRLERIVDRTLFASRISAQRRLRRVSRGMSHASAIASIENLLVREPYEAFALVSAAVFSRDPSGAYVRRTSVGWNESDVSAFDCDDAIVLQLLASKEPLSLAGLSFSAGSLPHGAQKPSIAMPLLVRSDLEAILFYGPHESQEDLDPDELDTLEHLLAAASGAYDHVRAEMAIRRVVELESRLKAVDFPDVAFPI